jgi:hypothetical protein
MSESAPLVSVTAAERWSSAVAAVEKEEGMEKGAALERENGCVVSVAAVVVVPETTRLGDGGAGVELGGHGGGDAVEGHEGAGGRDGEYEFVLADCAHEGDAIHGARGEDGGHVEGVRYGLVVSAE